MRHPAKLVWGVVSRGTCHSDRLVTGGAQGEPLGCPVCKNSSYTLWICAIFLYVRSTSIKSWVLWLALRNPTVIFFSSLALCSTFYSFRNHIIGETFKGVSDNLLK